MVDGFLLVVGGWWNVGCWWLVVGCGLSMVHGCEGLCDCRLWVV